jgi:hypothetical protein
METPNGALFAYSPDKNSRDCAWNSCDAVSQQVEWLLRGHASRVVGSQWQRWTETKETDDSMERLIQMNNLIMRLYQEGIVYMEMREARMIEKLGPKQRELLEEKKKKEIGGGKLAPITKEEAQQQLPAGTIRLDKIVKAADDKDETHEDGNKALEDDDNDDNNYEMTESFDSMEDLMADVDRFQSAQQAKNELEAHKEPSEPSYLNDFAAPGPTIFMSDTYLDALASVAHNCEWAHFETAYSALSFLLNRHHHDGGDLINTNLLTNPTMQSLNAPIRIAANLPYDALTAPETRDGALYLGFTCWDLIARSQQAEIKPNPATYMYLTQIVAKAFKPSRSRGLIAHGLLCHAQQASAVNEKMVEAFYDAAKGSADLNDLVQDMQADPEHTYFRQRYFANKRKLRYKTEFMPDDEDTY